MNIRLKKLLSRGLITALIVATLLSVLALSTSALSYGGSSSYRSGPYYSALTKVQLTGNQRVDIVNVAKSQIGYQEGANSSQLSGTSRGSADCTEYGRWYGLQDMWCAMFVSWCANTAGVSTSVVPKHAYTPSGLSWFQSRGLAYSRATVAKGGYTPQPGDIIYFKSSRNSNPTNHVGIVTGYSNGTVYTVEGNTSSATISTNGGAVAAKSYRITNTYIVYICSPRYSGSSVATPSTPSNNTSNNTQQSTVLTAQQNEVFNSTYYANKYSDLKAAFGSDANQLYTHFINSGIKEGRQASPIFSVKHYVQNNADLRAYGTDYQSAYNHFLQYGSKEARDTAPYVNLGDDFYAEIRNVNAGKNLSVNSSTGKVLTATDNSSDAQTWRFIRNSDGSYKIINKKTGLALDCQGSSYSAGATVQTYQDNGSNAQHWYIHEVSSGKYVLRPKCASTCVLDVKNASTAENAALQTYTFNGNAAQHFTIVKSTTPPAITNVTVSNVNAYGYTVTCTATAGQGIDRVLMPTWTEKNGQDDLVWHKATKNGDTYSFRINIADHKNESGNYITHIYAYDTKGTATVFVVGTQGLKAIDPPTITDVKVTNVDLTGYTVTCTVTAAAGVKEVRMPTWTDKNGQDDLVWHQATKNGNTYSYRVNISDHKKESGTYNTHIYAYDNTGKVSVTKITPQVINPSALPVLSNFRSPMWITPVIP